MNKKAIFALFLLAAAATWGCNNKQGTSESPVFILVDIALQPGFVNVGADAPVQINTITLTSQFKNPTATDPLGFATVTLNSYTVHFRRTDGGTVVPPDKTFGCGVTIAGGGGTATLTNFPVLTAEDTQLSPFDQLLPFNGGVDRETGRSTIQMVFDITFFGSTASGMRVQSETASGPLIFEFAGGTPLSRANRSKS
jgi:hypothetical protein